MAETNVVLQDPIHDLSNNEIALHPDDRIDIVLIEDVQVQSVSLRSDEGKIIEATYQDGDGNLDSRTEVLEASLFTE